VRFLLMVAAFLCVIVVIWYERNIGGRKTKVLYSIWNLAQNKKGKVSGVPVSLLNVIDSTNIPPKEVHTIVSKLDADGVLSLNQQTVKFTKYGESYFDIKYLKK
jgi:hypothetical protein